MVDFRRHGLLSDGQDLKLAEEPIFRGRGLTLEGFDRADTLAGRTPDFRVLLGDTLKAFCEVKSPRDDWLDDQIEAASPGQIAGGARSDPTFNRIARHVNPHSPDNALSFGVTCAIQI